jgi:hypothetical protein
MKRTLLISGISLIAVFALTACFSEQKEELTTETILDNELLSAAVSYRDVNKCAMIANAEKKAECNEVVNSLGIIDMAVSAEDKSICSQINLPKYKSACVSSVESETERTRIMKEKETYIQGLADKAGKYISEGNLEGCKSLADANYRQMCEAAIQNVVAEPVEE